MNQRARAGRCAGEPVAPGRPAEGNARMPERNPVTEPEKVQFIWFGEEMSDNARAGLRALSQRFPNSAKELVVMPRRLPGETGRRLSERGGAVRRRRTAHP